jgi:hypothetical protein
MRLACRNPPVIERRADGPPGQHVIDDDIHAVDVHRNSRLADEGSDHRPGVVAVERDVERARGTSVFSLADGRCGLRRELNAALNADDDDLDAAVQLTISSAIRRSG